MYGEIPGHGGARDGAGRPPGGADEERREAKRQFDEWRAHGEKFKALQAEVDYMADVGQYVPRASVQAASATALAVFTQAVRAIPDGLERALALEPRVVEAIAVALDTALGQLADDLKAMAEMPAHRAS